MSSGVAGEFVQATRPHIEVPSDIRLRQQYRKPYDKVEMKSVAMAAKQDHRSSQHAQSTIKNQDHKKGNFRYLRSAHRSHHRLN
mmetsp:Transcript_35904/g.40838  ORF Transcript_35904/g.40838 Transcript_35904/m.40838 type:complete len:84 (+) Transcript_35904:122-373(+)